MSTPVVYNGSSFNVPAYQDTGYAQGAGNLSAYLIALATGSVIITGTQNIAGFKNFTGQIEFSAGTASAPGMVVETGTGNLKTGIASLHSRSISFVTEDAIGAGVEAGYFNGSQQLILTNGTTAIPAIAFIRDGAAGLACQVADNMDLIAGASLVIRVAQTTVLDATYRTPINMFYGANTSYTKFGGQTTTSVSTSPTNIHTVDEFGTIIYISGNDATNYFYDCVVTGFGGNVYPVWQFDIQGAPANRSYTLTSSSNFKLAMDSGTYAINAFSIQQKAR